MSKKISLLIILVLCLMLAIPDFAKKPVADATDYTVELTGAFVFNDAMNVTLNVKKNGTIARSDQNVTMDRPTDEGPLAETWGKVFADCPELLSGSPNSIFVGEDDWEIDFIENDIRLLLFDIRLEDAEITLQLIGVPDYDENLIPPLSGTTSVFTLDKFKITGKSVQGGPGGSQGCHIRGTGVPDNLPLLDSIGNPVPSTLSITAP